MEETNNLTPEELKAEQEALREQKVEEIKASVISEFGFDPDIDGDKINKLVEREMTHFKKLSSAIGQKIKIRGERDKLLSEKTPAKPATAQPEDLTKTIDSAVNSRIEKFELDHMDYPDDVKAEISKVAHLKGISVKEAVKDPYLQYKIGEYEKTRNVEEAGTSRRNRAGQAEDTTADNPPDVDVTTPEGRKAYEAWKSEMRKKHPGNVGI